MLQIAQTQRRVSLALRVTIRWAERGDPVGSRLCCNDWVAVNVSADADLDNVVGG